MRRTRAVGAQHFRLFLEYAARGAAAINAAATLTPQADFDSTFEKQVHDRLRQRGWDMDLQVGCSGYRIDLAVRHPEAGGRYLCGVECDGASYHSAKTARDRDRLRQSVLESLGWSMLRVWSTDFWHDPDGTIDRIHRSLNELLNESMDVAPMLKGVNAKRVDHENPNADCVQSPSSGVVPPALPTPALPVFCVARAIPPLGEGEAFYDSEASRRIVARINEVVSIEAPLHRKRLASKVASAFGLSRVTARVINRMSELVSASGAWEVDGFVWGNQEQRSTWSSFRVPDRSDDDSMRPVDQIAPEELMAAMVHIVELNAALDRAELVRETANLFGIKRVTSGIRTHLLSVVSALVGSGSACEKEDTIRLV